MSSWASQAHTFHQPVCQRLSWLHHWSVPHVHTIGVFSPSEWGPDPQCQAAQEAHWTWWWQCLAAWHCRSVWSLPCHFAAEAGGLALSMAKSRWHGALRSAHKSCTHGHVFWKRIGVKRELVADPWTSSRQYSHMLWLKVQSHLLLRACLLGSKRKLPPQACQVQPGLSSLVCYPRGVQFPGTVYICSQGLLSSSWAHCISCAPSACSHCRRCCCSPLQSDRGCMETCLNSAGGPVVDDCCLALPPRLWQPHNPEGGEATVIEGSLTFPHSCWVSQLDAVLRHTQDINTQEPLLNTVHYCTILDIMQFKDGTPKIVYPSKNVYII